MSRPLLNDKCPTSSRNICLQTSLDIRHVRRWDERPSTLFQWNLINIFVFALASSTKGSFVGRPRSRQGSLGKSASASHLWWSRSNLHIKWRVQQETRTERRTWQLGQQVWVHLELLFVRSRPGNHMAIPVPVLQKWRRCFSGGISHYVRFCRPATVFLRVGFRAIWQRRARQHLESGSDFSR